VISEAGRGVQLNISPQLVLWRYRPWAVSLCTATFICTSSFNMKKKKRMSLLPVIAPAFDV